MDYRLLGKTGISASRLCFGTLTFSPLQKNLPIKQSVDLLMYAFSKGVNILDTAELYNNYKAIGKATNKFGREKISIVAKSYSYDKKTAKASFDKARKELDTDYIDIFMLHEQESEHTLRGHSEAIEYFLELKQKGLIRAFGISTHFISGVDAAAKHAEIDVLHPIFNSAGIGIVDGAKDQMYNAIVNAHDSGIGIIAMKALGGGHLIKNADEALEYALDCDFLDCIALGMQSEQEIDYNVAFFEGNRNLCELEIGDKKLYIHDWCNGCGKCAARCAMGGIVLEDGKARAIQSKCVLCGYCASVCEDFCIKVL